MENTCQKKASLTVANVLQKGAINAQKTQPGKFRQNNKEDFLHGHI